jgi:nucleoside-diphosphate-sugar epimerase
MTDMSPEPHRLLLTGATGFLGSAIAAAALEAGWQLRVIARDPAAVKAEPWGQAEALDIRQADLAGPQARADLDAALADVAVVIHAAGAMAGNDEAQRRNTVEPTRTLVEAMTARTPSPLLVLISSLSVYNYAAMPMGSTLDETTPLEPEPGMRDAYCRAKLAQEALVRAAAQHDGLRARVLRPGAIVGPGRLRTARLGLALGPLLLMPGGHAAVPVIAVEDCAALTVRAASAPAPASGDVATLTGNGWFEAINLVDPDQPDQRHYAAAIRRAAGPRMILRMPLGLARAPARAIALAGLVLPGLARRMPGPFRLETFDSRFKPLRFSAARAQDRLGWPSSPPFAQTLQGLRGTGTAATAA